MYVGQKSLHAAVAFTTRQRGLVGDKHLGNLVADFLQGIQCGHRILKYHADACTA